MNNHKKIDWFRWHQRKIWIRINCAILSAILLIVLLLMFPIVSDASSDIYLSEVEPDISDNLINQPGYEDFNSNYSDTFYLNVLTSSNYLNTDYLDGDVSNGEYKINFDSSDFGAYDTYPIRYIQNSNGSIQLHLWKPDLNSYPDVEFKLVSYHQGSSSNYSDVNLCISSDGINYYSGAPSIGLHVVYNLSGDTFVKSQTIWNQNYITVDGEQYLNASLGTPMAINYCNTSLWSTSTNEFFANGVEALASSNLYDLNYSSSESGSITYPDGSGGTDANNLYMRTADWQFNIPKYWPSVNASLVQPAYTSSWGSGNIIFYGLLNDYQKANSSNFTLNFKFHVWISGHRFSDTHANINENFYGSFNYNDVTVSLSDFIQSNNTYTFSVSDIFAHAQNGANQTVSDFINPIKSYNSIDNWNWYISCDAWLTSGNGTSGHIVEKYDFISQVSQEDSNTITDNDNPYIPPDGETNIDNPDNTSTTTSKNGGNITIYNTNNNNNSLAGGGGTTLSKLINMIFGDNTVNEGSIGDNTQDKLLTMTGANRWLSVMNSSLSFIPFTVWAELSLFFGIILSILVVAFILRIILDIL